MKKYFAHVAFAGISLLGFASCQSDDEPQIMDQEENRIEMTPLGKILVNVIDSHDNGMEGDSYILYDASENEFITMSAEDYTLANAFGNMIDPEHNLATRVPRGEGWVFGGHAKGKIAAMKLARDLSNKLEEQRDYEIHVEYDEDGSFSVWYRYI